MIHPRPQERIEKPGEVVGYQIRLESKVSERTRLMFCTTGILLRRLEGEPDLNDVTHIIVDEVHERSEESDFLLMILRDTLKRRPDLRVVLMSATVNADLFSSYFRDCPVLEIPGRTFPVQQVLCVFLLHPDNIFKVFLEEILENIPYALEERSPYARREDKNPSKVDKSAFKGDCRDAYLDDLDADLLLSGSEGFKPAADNRWDERCTIKQVMPQFILEFMTCKVSLQTTHSARVHYAVFEAY